MRGDVVLIDFPFSHGGASKVRPALIVQSDNLRSVNTIVAQISSNLARTGPTRHLVDPAVEAASGLLMPSVILCEALYSLHESRVIRTIGSLTAATMTQIGDCLKAALSLR